MWWCECTFFITTCRQFCNLLIALSECDVHESLRVTSTCFVWTVGLELYLCHVYKLSCTTKTLSQLYYFQFLFILGLGYKFMNKISISKTCLYNFSYKQAAGYLHNNPSLQRAFGYSSAQYRLRYSTQSSDSRRLLGGVRVQTSTSVCSRCCTQNAVYQHFIYLYDIAAGPQEAFLKEKFSSLP